MPRWRGDGKDNSYTEYGGADQELQNHHTPFFTRPFFHNASAKILLDVVNFYEHRFNLVLTRQEESDLVAFLSAL